MFVLLLVATALVFDAPPDDVEAPPPVVPLGLATAAVPVFTTAPMPAVDGFGFCGTELTAVVPVVAPPVPATVPAVAAPLGAALLFVEPLLAVLPLAEPLLAPPLAPLLLVVVMAFAGGRVGLVLVSVPEGVVAAPGVAAAPGVVPGVNVGNVTAPVPT